jgi:hypothetical protein
MQRNHTIHLQRRGYGENLIDCYQDGRISYEEVPLPVIWATSTTWSLGPDQSFMILPVEIASGFGVLKYCKISNFKHQITNKSQIPIFNDQNKKQVWNF